MKKILFTLAALLLFNPFVNSETLKFAQVTDVHYPKTGIMGYEGRSLDFAVKNYIKAIDMINNSDIEYVFLQVILLINLLKKFLMISLKQLTN